MNLDGVWRAAPADDDLRRNGIGLDVDDTSWSAVSVPGHWRHETAFAEHDGPVLYRTGFASSAPPAGRRRWLALGGIFYQADVWLDGAYLGDPEGYFFDHTFDITALSRIDDDHVVAIEVDCAAQPRRRGRRTITGVFQNPEVCGDGWNPGGIWRPVRVFDTGPVRADRFRVLCRDADASRAHLLIHADLDSDSSRRIVIRTLVDGEAVAEHHQQVAAGMNEVNWTLDIDDPALWWPRALGSQPLTDISVEIVCDGEISDSRTRRTGLRQVAWNDWACSVNGERIFLKGANLLPSSRAIGAVDDEVLVRDVEAAVEAGLDALRVHGHIAPPAVYDAADQLGVLLLQDFPLMWGHSRSVRGVAVSQARVAVDELGHHPSIVQWNAHDDPTAVDGGRLASTVRSVAAQQLPGWNKSVLDRWVKRSIERADPTRLVVPHSGVLPHFPLLDGTDSHLYFGWRHGEMVDLDRLARSVPRMVRFVSEFGAQSVPDDIAIRSSWPDVDWDDLTARHGLERHVFERRVPPHEYSSPDEWQDACERYQAELIRHHIEVIRKLKYRPAGGFCVFALNDPSPVSAWGVLGPRRRRKRGWTALVEACRPLIVVAERPPDVVCVDDRLELDIHVVNDLRRVFESATVDASVRWAGGSMRRRFEGEITADGCVLVGVMAFDVPDTLGTLTVDLVVNADDVVATNRYSTTVTARPDGPTAIGRSRRSSRFRTAGRGASAPTSR